MDIASEISSIQSRLSAITGEVDAPEFLQAQSAPVSPYAEPIEDPSAGSTFTTMMSQALGRNSGFGGSTAMAPSELEPMINRSAAAYNVDPSLVKAVIANESGFNSNAVSPVGAQGLMQLMPETAASLGVTNSFDPAQNIAGGTRYLRGLFDRFGDWRLAVAAYNAGPGAVSKYGGVPPYAETRSYVANVMGSYSHYSAQ